MYEQKELEQKTEKQLIGISEELGLSVNADNTDKKTLIQAILSAQNAEELEPSSPDDPDLVEEAVAKKPMKKYRLIIANQEGPEATAFVKVCVNGDMFTIPRNKEVVVPESVIEVLRNAVIVRLVQEGNTLLEQAAPRFPFTVLGPAK